MKTKKAKLLNKFLLTAIKVFNDTSTQVSVAAYEIDGLPVRFSDHDFENLYYDFLEELQEVVISTKDIDIAREHIVVSLNDIVNWDGFTIDQEKVIFTAGHQVSYLINLKRNIEKYVSNVLDLCKRDNFDEISEELIEFYERTIAGINPIHDPAFLKRRPPVQQKETYDSETIPLNRFDLARLKVECEKLPDTLAKLNFMEDQLYDYRQLEIESKKDISLKKILANSHNFEKLCIIEIERLQRKLERVQKYHEEPVEDQHSSNELPVEPGFIWKGSDADLLELVTALYKAEAIKRRDGKKISFEEMLRLFEKMFNYQLKGPRDLQLASMGPNKITTPFLDSLETAFEAYFHERDGDKSKLN